MLKVTRLSKSFSKNSLSFLSKDNKKIPILKNISFNALSGETIAILGPNGCGKTTLLKMIAGLLISDSGFITDENGNKLSNSKIAMVNSNDRSFFWRLSVIENLRFFCELSNKNSSIKIIEILESLKLQNKINTPFMFLSYGERKKVSIARALLKDCKILLLDEITNSLDISAKKLVTESIKSLMKEGKVKLILFATHSLDEVMSLSNRLLFIEKNKILYDLKINDKTTLDDIEALF
ncbi:MAG: hypothetical protein CMD29_00940 [Flavobacteriales bacterium]|nr:hypothetical protein [Flavobacteriales bacterium]|tara:strand:- start:114 stop:824 length:711 start_codon:yes stop_codon:yes gene_type:complete